MISLFDLGIDTTLPSPFALPRRSIGRCSLFLNVSLFTGSFRIVRLLSPSEELFHSLGMKLVSVVIGLGGELKTILEVSELIISRQRDSLCGGHPS